MITVIHDDDTLLVINKPAGLPTLGDSGSKESSLESELVSCHPELNGITDHGIAHRIDNDTSGIICIGKTKDAYDFLRKQFSENTAIKSYKGLALGASPSKDIIEAHIAHHPRKKKKMVVCESLDRAKELKARPAITEYEVTQRYHYMNDNQATPYSLLDVVIHTGIRHQIRAHLAWRGFPIAGDGLYQNPKKREEDVLPLDRHFLHASHLEIIHPATKNRLSFDCVLPEDLMKALKRLSIR